MIKVRLFSIGITGLCLMMSLFISGQVYEKYPSDQVAYEGGNVQFYKEFHQVIVEQDIKPCENANEFYNLSLVVYPDSTVKFLKDDDTENITRNKCAYDLGRRVAPHLNGWSPALVDGEGVTAVARFLIVPKDLFEKYKEGYDVTNDFSKAEFPGGIIKLQNKVFKNINTSGLKFGGVYQGNLGFDVDERGNVTDVKLEKSSGLKEFDDMLLKAAKKVKDKWTPANICDIPVKSYFSLPVSFEIE